MQVYNKDPLNDKETPYEILDIIDINIKYNQLNKAFNNKLMDIDDANDLDNFQIALNELNNPNNRFLIDLSYYITNEVNKEQVGELNINFDINQFIKIPKLDENEIYSDLMNNDIIANVKIDYLAINFDDAIEIPKEPLLMEFSYDI